MKSRVHRRARSCIMGMRRDDMALSVRDGLFAWRHCLRSRKTIIADCCSEIRTSAICCPCIATTGQQKDGQGSIQKYWFRVRQHLVQALLFCKTNVRVTQQVRARRTPISAYLLFTYFNEMGEVGRTQALSRIKFRRKITQLTMMRVHRALNGEGKRRQRSGTWSRSNVKNGVTTGRRGPQSAFRARAAIVKLNVWVEWSALARQIEYAAYHCLDRFF